jgi:sulfonate dioxygenase
LSLPEFSDPGLRADSKKPNLLKEGVAVKKISPYIGAVVEGVQVSQLSKEGLDELALYVAERKVVVFRDQDFKDLAPERQIEIARSAITILLLILTGTDIVDTHSHFGPIQIHPTSGNVKGFPEFHVGQLFTSTHRI